MITTSSSAKLSFTSNLLFFDTVFVTQGSTARIFVVHNYNNEAIVTNIKLQGSYMSPFQINVDGVPGQVWNNVKIPANDSIYVFTRVNVDPLNVNNPALIKDSLVFNTNGNTQWVDLQAFGWNAYFYVPNVFPATGPPYSVVKCGDVWKNDKPHVVFGYLLDTCTLTIEQGTHVYFHDSASLYVLGTLKVQGSPTQPVTFQGDRLEPAYNYLPGQWGEIFLAPGSVNNTISWAVIQNGTTGIQADTIGNTNPTLQMDHTIIKGMSGYGLLGEGATITANNCLIADCQSSCVFLYIGGNYHFYGCTFADYWGVDNSFGQRSTPLLYINNNYQSSAMQNIGRSIDSAYFGNCIIYGALQEEIGLDSNFGAKFNYYFDNCVLKTQHSFVGFHNNGMLYINQDPSFNNIGIDDYTVNGSSALGHADPSIVAK